MATSSIFQSMFRTLYAGSDTRSSPPPANRGELAAVRGLAGQGVLRVGVGHLLGFLSGRAGWWARGMARRRHFARHGWPAVRLQYSGWPCRLLLSEYGDARSCSARSTSSDAVGPTTVQVVAG